MNADALAAEGKASVRRYKLLEDVVWLVVGLFRDRSTTHVVQSCTSRRRVARGERGRIGNAAIVQVHEQLGQRPLAGLFAQTARVRAPPAGDGVRGWGLAVYDLDGTTLRVADTPENVAASGEGAGTRSCGW